MNPVEMSSNIVAGPRAEAKSFARTIALAAVLLLAGGAARCADESTAWGVADAAYEAQHYAEALDGYEALARDGDAVAAERAGLMLYFAGTLYGTALPQDLPRAEGWLKQAATAGSESARHLLVRLDRHRRAADAAASGASGETTYTIGRFGC